ncbi:hypothetical protein GpartN1_g3956.t1 [Galdieria partita]|uniref:Translation initiation factor IF2/IF5 domain-containing protein n=1 Tax=Galdieria partita TaxID=83374 RepID=A0A9C7PXB6_9RHOD|nr:hypothetical protein GpartN1_g3956.t1 [Galdieria partita]
MDDQALEASFESQPTFFDPTQKKKKKKSKLFKGGATIENPEAGVAEDLESLSLGENGMEDNENNSDVDEEDNEDTPAQLNFGKKKKKKKKVTFSDELPEGEDVEKDLEKLEGEESPWSKSDRDYTYQELLRRIFDFLHGKHPSLAGESRKRFTLRPPQIAREGSKKTVFMNFGDICKSIHRQPEHLLAYMSTEMGTTGNLQEGGRLVLKGRFQPKGIENVLRRYILEYVICKSCRSPESTLMRDANTRLYFLRCESCGATRSVTPIRQGYVAQVGRRKRD